MKKLYILSLIIFFSFSLFSQTNNLVTSDTEKDILVAFTTPSDFETEQIVAFMRELSGVDVIQYCNAHQAVYARIDSRYYKEETMLYAQIETTFPGLACFNKNSSDEALNDFFRMCYEEIAKPID